MKQNTAILDIGSSKVICLICSAQGRDSITVRGAGVKEYPGFENGRFIDEQLFSSAVVDAIAMAEGEAKVRIRDLSVGVPASFSKLVLHEGSAGVKSRTGRINGDTIDDLINDSLTFEQPEGYELMHSTPVEFKIGETVTADPPLGQAADAQRQVQPQAAGGNGIHLHGNVGPKLHHGAFAKLLFDLGQCRLQRCLFIPCRAGGELLG